MRIYASGMQCDQAGADMLGGSKQLTFTRKHFIIFSMNYPLISIY